MSSGTGLRFNQGKSRIELLPPGPLEEITKVFTYGADKYTVKDASGKIIVRGDNNWRGGMQWTSVLASAKRHLEKFSSGEDFDEESGVLHLAHAATNMMFLLEYYKIFPQGDNRTVPYLKKRRIGLDIDDVCSDFVPYWCNHWKCDIPTSWNFDRNIAAKFDALKSDKDWYMNIPVKTDPKTMNFEPVCYITSRSIPKEWTEEWLDKNKFPAAKVYSVGLECSKIEAAKDAKIDLFVDDRYDNFVELTNAGIFTYLMDAAHNRRYNVGHRRIFDLSKL